MPISWIYQPAQALDAGAMARAQHHHTQLTKPPGALGLLESIPPRFAGFQGNIRPELNKVSIVLFAGDHGVCQQNISAFPQVVTGQMLMNFASGGAAINVLSRQLGADLTVVNLGLAQPLADLTGVLDYTIAPGTRDFSVEPAMSASECQQAFNVGNSFARQGEPDLLIGGEMGIGNTTSAAALYSALLDLGVDQAVGPGTGIVGEALQRKRNVVQQALALHRLQLQDPITLLQSLGGFEIAALTGFYIAAAQRGVPILVDGYITTAAALLAVKINPSVRDWLLFSHCSAEPAHKIALNFLNAVPLLDLGMRLGEGSGAAVAVPLIQSALLLHSEMATFGDAGVSRDG